MSDDSGDALEPEDVNSFRQHIEDIGVERVDTGSPLELRRSPDGELFKHLRGPSASFRPAAKKFSPMTEDIVEKLAHDLQDFTQGVDFAVFVPAGVAPGLMEDDYSLPMYTGIESRDDDYVSRIWGQDSLGGLLESRGFSRFNDYLEGQMFDKGRMLFVGSSRNDAEPWEGRDAELIYHQNAVFSSETEVATDALSSLDADIRETDVKDGSMTVEVYPGRYDEVEAREEEEGVALYGDGEQIVFYPGFSIARGGDDLEGPAAFQLEERYEPGVEQE
ncbi:MAG: hypothetical protein ABEJ91_02565 [Candidatus Nanohaloarchaea archaeon]